MTLLDAGLLGGFVGWFGGALMGSLLYAWISTPMLIVFDAPAVAAGQRE